MTFPFSVYGRGWQVLDLPIHQIILYNLWWFDITRDDKRIFGLINIVTLCYYLRIKVYYIIYTITI